MDDLFEKCGEATFFLKLIANENRLAVLCSLHDQQRNVSQLSELVGIPQAAMSGQLAKLREAGLVDCTVNHRERLYFIADERVRDIIGLLHDLFCDQASEAKRHIA
ncbi:metalloregulator ArsR/SmtB family transcription factor [Suttonella sp. R2A3]|uniref:ArsR/SmtB family transcription factor n=1 Tax=Suttonella sp. R2A3 TaxID=2908648 RepID=UPI001F1C7A2A|nr:metalloregulator ArsR/SmtB family transcription factor [Suttonella sp. R2A3]UJF24108.1 metalloregulator ArsR/SmtB family transcription factor [Suttonella sp. R2A3]